MRGLNDWQKPGSQSSGAIDLSLPRPAKACFRNGRARTRPAHDRPDCAMQVERQPRDLIALWHQERQARKRGTVAVQTETSNYRQCSGITQREKKRFHSAYIVEDG